MFLTRDGDRRLRKGFVFTHVLKFPSNRFATFHTWRTDNPTEKIHVSTFLRENLTKVWFGSRDAAVHAYFWMTSEQSY